MRDFSPVYLWYLLLLLTGSRAAQANSLPTGLSAGRSLAEALNPDGTLHAGTDGAFDARNFSMVMAPNGRPAFHPLSTAGTGDERWQNGFDLANGANSSVTAIVQSGTNLYVGGSFKVVGTVAANGVARWNGVSWSSLGTGPANGVGTPTAPTSVNALALATNGDLYVGGSFTQAGGLPANNIARWNGAVWSALGTTTANGVTLPTLGDPVQTLAVSTNGDLYVGGNFTQAGSLATNNIARWNGTSWAALGASTTNGTNNTVLALAVATTGDVYAGGSFTQAGGAATGYVARWTGTAWVPLGAGTTNGTNSSVQALAVTPTGDVYIGGTFTQAGGAAAGHVARWDGTTWSPLGTGIVVGQYTGVFALSISSTGAVYVGGYFDQAGSTPAANVAQWNGTAWSALGTSTTNGTTGGVLALVATTTGQVYVGGAFGQAGAGLSNNIAYYTGLTWNALGANTTNGLNGTVSKVVVAPNGDVYVAGFFRQAGNVPASGVAKWNGTNWSALGMTIANGVDGYIEALALAPNGDLYVGGNFSRVGGVNANYVARWNGTTWSSLGTGSANGVDGPVYALTVTPTGTVYVGGGFFNAGGQPANHIARWNGTTWTSLGTGPANGLNGNGIFALALASNGDLYVGGIFQNAGGQSANGVAKWNGTAWSSLGIGVNNGVAPFAFALAFAPNGDLYVGGSFSTAGTTAANGIARWDGTNWNVVGNTTSAFVRTLAVAANGDLYLGGNFTAFAGQSLNQIARWNGTTWSPLGTGLNDAVASIAFGPTGKLYAGGAFSTVGDGSKVTANFGIYDPNQPLVTSTTPANRLPAALFPNPAHDAATLRLPAGAPRLPIALTDGLGRVVRRYPAPLASDVTLDLRGLPIGLYLMQCGQLTQRLLVE